MTGGRACAALALAAALVPAQAQACRISSAHTSVIHNSLPTSLPRNLIAAKVEFESADVEAVRGPGVRARVLKMIQGRYRGKTLIVRQSMTTSCSQPFENGHAGLIVGIPVGTEDGLLVIDPIEVGRSSGYRLPPSFQLPKGYFAEPLVR